MEGTASPAMSSGIHAVTHPDVNSPETQFPVGTEVFKIGTPEDATAPATTVQPEVELARLDSETRKGDQREGPDEESYERRGENTPPPRENERFLH